MKRLAYLLKKFPRLSETFILTELLGQQARGMDVSIYSRRPADDEPRHPELATLRAPVTTLPGRSGLDPWTELFTERDPGPEEWAAIGHVVRTLRPLVGDRLPRLVAEGLLLRRLFEDDDIGHVHVHFATESAIAAWIVHQLGGPPYSITAHAKDIYRSTVRPELLDLLVGTSAFTVTVCNANVEHMRGLVSPESATRIRRLYNGLDLERFPYRPEPRDGGEVLAVGRLVEKKGFDDLLTAMALLRDRGVDARCTLVGDGDQRQALVAQAARLGLRGTVTFAGALDQGAVREKLSRATLLALPCIIGDDGNRDALPTVLLEAQAVGLPCISTPVTGVPEILDDGRAGVLVGQRDPEALADAIEALLADPERRLALARAGRARADELFNSTRVAADLSGWFSVSLARALSTAAQA